MSFSHENEMKKLQEAYLDIEKKMREAGHVWNNTEYPNADDDDLKYDQEEYKKKFWNSEASRFLDFISYYIKQQEVSNEFIEEYKMLANEYVKGEGEDPNIVGGLPIIRD